MKNKQPKPPSGRERTSPDGPIAYNIQFVITDPALRRKLREMAIAYGESIGDFRTQGAAVAKALVEEMLLHPEQAERTLAAHAERVRENKEPPATRR